MRSFKTQRVKDGSTALAFAQRQKKRWQKTEGNSCRTEDKAHSREEIRWCTVLPSSELSVEMQESWVGLKMIVRVDSERKCKGKAESEMSHRYFIASMVETPQTMLKNIRGHWSIENSLHWVLYVGFREDMSKKEARNAAANYSAILKVAMNLLQKVEEKKVSMARKRKKCRGSDQYREKCLGF